MNNAPPAATTPARRLPVMLIGGYLGAGKTTLVNHLLRQADGRRIAVLVNDFGSINIDADLIDGQASAGVLALSGGCLCCSFGDDLVGTVNGLLARDPAPDLCLIELSGVALPDAVRRSLGLALAAEVVGTLVLADASQIQRQAGDRYVGDTVCQQLAAADWLLLNKPDLLSPEDLQAVADDLRTRWPQARLWAGTAAGVPPELLLGWRAPATDPALRSVHDAFGRRPLAGARPAAPAVFDSCSLDLPGGVDLDALGAALAAPGSGVLRAKGLAVDANGQGRLLQVAGNRWAVTPHAVQGSGRLVLIGLRGHWDPQALQARCAATAR